MTRNRIFQIGHIGLVAVTLVAAACGDGSTDVAAEASADTTVAPEPSVADDVAAEASADTTVAPEPEVAGAAEDDTSMELPITLSGRTLGLVNLEPIEGGQIVDIAGTLLTEDGSFVNAAFTLIDLRVEGANDGV